MKFEIQTIINEIALAFHAPTSVKTSEDAAAWSKLFAETILAETKEPMEIHQGWVDFKRTFDRPFWPTPGEVCKSIRQVRADRHAHDYVHRNQIAPPDYHKPALVSHATRNATLTALAQADVMAQSSDAREAALGRQLVALGLAIINRNGQPAEEFPL